MPKRVYQPSKSRRKKQFGFRKRNQTKKGKNVLKRRRSIKRKRLAA